MLRFLASLVVTLGLAGVSLGDVAWDNGAAGDNSWLNPTNWDGDVLPTSSVKAVIGLSSPDAPIVDAIGAISADTEVGVGGVGELNIVSGGELEVDQLSIGRSFDGTVNISGGTLMTRGAPQGGNGQIIFGDGENGEHGQLNMTGGLVIANSSVYLGFNLDTTAHMQLDGGVFSMPVSTGLYVNSPPTNPFDPRCDDGGNGTCGSGTIDLAGGMVSVIGDQTAQFLYYHPIETGRTTGYNQTTIARLYYDASIDRTRLTGWLPGDIDSDTNVDGNDFLLWQQNFEVPASFNPHVWTPGDENRDRDVDSADLAIWQNNFGNTDLPPALHAVPEPSALILLLTAAAMACGWRKQ